MLRQQHHNLRYPMHHVSISASGQPPYIASLTACAETLEHLAVARLRQWAYDRRQLRHGRASDIKPKPGRSGQRNPSRFDARVVRCIDFERAFLTLAPEHQALLWLRYADGDDMPAAAAAAGVSIRTAAKHMPAARQALAAILDRRDLL
jgi:DNA-directed RNA polymerase specialized sigma24 family protein